MIFGQRWSPPPLLENPNNFTQICLTIPYVNKVVWSWSIALSPIGLNRSTSLQLILLQSKPLLTGADKPTVFSPTFFGIKLIKASLSLLIWSQIDLKLSDVSRTNNIETLSVSAPLACPDQWSVRRPKGSTLSPSAAFFKVLWQSLSVSFWLGFGWRSGSGWWGCINSALHGDGIPLYMQKWSNLVVIWANYELLRQMVYIARSRQVSDEKLIFSRCLS